MLISTGVYSMGDSNACQNSQATAVHGDVLNREGTKESAGEVPAAEGGQGIQASKAPELMPIRQVPG